MAEATLLGQNSGNGGSSDNESIYERPVSFDFEDVPYKRNILNTETLISGNSDTYTQIGSVSFTFNSAESIIDDDNVYLRIEGKNKSVSGNSEKAYLYCKSTTGTQYISTSIISTLGISLKNNVSYWGCVQYFKIPKTSLTDGNIYNLYIKTTNDEYGDDFSVRIKSIDYLYNVILSNIVEYYPSSKISYNRIFYPFDHYIDQNKIIELTGEATLLAPSGLIYNYSTVVANYYSIEKSFLELN